MISDNIGGKGLLRTFISQGFKVLQLSELENSQFQPEDFPPFPVGFSGSHIGSSKHTCQRTMPINIH